MSEHCGTTTEEGNAVCIPGSCSCSSAQENKDEEKQPIEAQTGETHVDQSS